MPRLGVLVCLALSLLMAAQPAYAAPGTLRWFKTYPEMTTLGYPANLSAGALQPDGKLVAAGYAYQGPSFQNADWIVARLDPATGALDASFGQGGVVRIAIDLRPNGNDIAYAVAIGPGGRILVAGDTQPASGPTDMAVVALTSTGVPDAGFGPQGLRTVNFFASSIDRARSVVVDGAGTVTIGGLAGGSGPNAAGFGLARFDATGQPVAAFGGTGRVVTPFGAAAGGDEIADMVLLDSGELIAAGTAERNSVDADLALARYSALGVASLTRVFAAAGRDDAGALELDGQRLVVGSERRSEGTFAPSTITQAFSLSTFDPVAGFGTGDTLGVPSLYGGLAPRPGGGFFAFGSGPFGGGILDDWQLAFLGADGTVAAGPGNYPGTADKQELPGDVVTAGELAVMLGSQSDIPAGGAVDPTPDPVDHYRIELKAWIPFEVIVDPLRPARLPFFVGFLGNDCYDPGVFSTKVRTYVESLLDGDGHYPYDGGFRGFTAAEFDWDGRQISNFTSSGQFGPTSRFLEYEVVDVISGETRTIRCVANRGQATTLAEARPLGAGNGYELQIQTAIPLIPLAPSIDDRISGTVSGVPPESRLDFNYSSDLFPSHGFRVYKNGIHQATQIINDASCLGPQGARGPLAAVLLGWGLAHEHNRGSYAVGPHDVGRHGTTPSLLCSATYLLTQAITEGLKVPGLFAGSSAAPKLSVAEVDARGRRGPWLSVTKAVAAGLVIQRRDGDRTELLSSPGIAVRAQGRRIALAVSDVKNGKAGATRVYRARGELIAAGGAVTSKGKRVRAGAPDRTPPVTRATVSTRGSKATVTFRVRDRSGVAALDVQLRGKRLKLRRGRVTVATKQLTALRFGAVDVFGNRETLKAVKRR